MKVAILAGGKGVRYSCNNEKVPKPLAPIGGRPILWHLFKYYQSFGFHDFVIALGHRGHQIRQHFRARSRSPVAVGHLRSNGSNGSNGSAVWNNREPLQLDFVDTGINTPTAARVRRLRDHLDDGPFMMTWSDGLADIDLDRLLDFHRSHGKLATVTAVHPPARFGELTIDGDCVTAFHEKPKHLKKEWINGAFFVLEPGIFDYIPDRDVAWEREPMENLARDGQLMAYRHSGFWQCMDTVTEQKLLEDFWQSGNAPWKRWN